MISVEKNDHPLLTLGGTEELDQRILERTEFSGQAIPIRAPMREDDGWWIFHPTERTAHGEAILYKMMRDTGGLRQPRHLDVGSVFIERLAALLGQPIEAPYVQTLVNAPVLKETGSTRLIDIPDGAIRNIAFASLAKIMAVVQDDAVSILSGDRLGSFVHNATLGLEQPVQGPSRAQFAGRRLNITDEVGFLVVDVTRASQPHLMHAFRQGLARQIGTILGEHAYFYLYHYEEQRSATLTQHPEALPSLPRGSDGLFIQNIDSEFETRLCAPLNGGITDLLCLGDRMFMSQPDGLRWIGLGRVPMRPAQRDEIASVQVQLDDARLVGFITHQMIAALNMGSQDTQAAAVIDVSYKEPRVVARLLPGHTVRAWETDEDLLHLVTAVDTTLAFTSLRIGRQVRNEGGTFRFPETASTSPVTGTGTIRAVALKDGVIGLHYADGGVRLFQRS